MKTITNPGSDRSAAGYNAAGRNAGPQGGNKIGDQVKNGADGGIKPLKCVDTGGIGVGSVVRSSFPDVRRVGDGDGEHRRFLFSVATIASFASFCYKLIPHKLTKQHFFLLYIFLISNQIFLFFKQKISWHIIKKFHK